MQHNCDMSVNTTAQVTVYIVVIQVHYWLFVDKCFQRTLSISNVSVLSIFVVNCTYKLLQTATVTAHTIDIPQSQTDGHQSSVNSSPYKTKTVFLVKFDQEVMRREAQLT
jgi:hypothetical protein